MAGDVTSAVDFGALFESAPNPYVLFDRELTIVACNAAYEREVRRKRAEFIGRNVFEAFPSDPASPGGSLVRSSLAKVLAEARADDLVLIPYNTAPPGAAPEMRYWSATHTPILGPDRRVTHILQHTTDVTAVETLRQTTRGMQDEAGLLGRAAAVQAENVALAQQSEDLRRLFQQSPSFMAVLSGPEHVFTLVNDAYQRLVGADRPVVGRSVGEALPEVVKQGFVDLLDRVQSTGEPFIGRAVPILLQPDDSGVAMSYLDFIYQPIRDGNGEIVGIFVQGHDITEQKLAEQELLRQREMLRIAQEAGGVGTFLWDLETGMLTGSPTFNMLYGLPADSGPLPYEAYVNAVHPADRSRLATAETSLDERIRRTEYRVVLPDGRIRWIERQGTVVRGAEGQPVQVLGASFDVSDRQDRETQMTLLAQESAHRIKNLLTMVQAITTQTLRSAESLAAARTAISERLMALAQAQDMLTQGSEEGTGLKDLVISAIRLHDTGANRFHVEGPNVLLGSRTSLGLRLMLHELGTNAAKYGALSVPEGQVSIGWAEDAAGNIDWHWVERGGPAVTAPARRGFGSSLIERGLSSLPGSKVVLEFSPEGVVCRARLVLDSQP